MGTGSQASKPTWINPCVELGGREHAPCASDMQAVKNVPTKAMVDDVAAQNGPVQFVQLNARIQQQGACGMYVNYRLFGLAVEWVSTG